jgi:hypothetical protein
MSACCYGVGVISLGLRVELADGASGATLVGPARSIERADLAAVFGPALVQLASQLRPAITRAGDRTRVGGLSTTRPKRHAATCSGSILLLIVIEVAMGLIRR